MRVVTHVPATGATDVFDAWCERTGAPKAFSFDVEVACTVALAAATPSRESGRRGPDNAPRVPTRSGSPLSASCVRSPRRWFEMGRMCRGLGAYRPARNGSTRTPRCRRGGRRRGARRIGREGAIPVSFGRTQAGFLCGMALAAVFCPRPPPPPLGHDCDRVRAGGAPPAAERPFFASTPELRPARQASRCPGQCAGEGRQGRRPQRHRRVGLGDPGCRHRQRDNRGVRRCRYR